MEIVVGPDGNPDRILLLHILGSVDQIIRTTKEATFYTEPDQSVKLVLKNNIVMRMIRQKMRTASYIGEDNWDRLDDLEKMILAYVMRHGAASRDELVRHTEKSSSTIIRRLNHLCEIGILKPNGRKRAPGLKYSINIDD